MRILAIDYGSKRLGLAISDEGGTLALALGLVERRRGETDPRLVQRLAQRILEEGPDEIVVGLPQGLNGRTNTMSRTVKKFVGLLTKAVEVPVQTWDERLSSHEAESRLRDAPLSRRKKRGHVNVVAAQVILEEFLKERGKEKEGRK